MENDRSGEAAQLLLAAITREKQARADQHRAVLSLAQDYTANRGAVIDDEAIDSLIEDTAPRGAYGTVAVSEFAGMELAGLMGCSQHQADTTICETLNLYYRHRPMWDAVQNLTLDAHRASKAAGKFGTLPPELAAEAGRMWVQRQHRLGWQGAIDLCDKIIIHLDPVTAAAKEAAQLARREVRIWEAHEGTINLTAKLDALDARYLYATASRIATILHTKPEYTTVAIDVLRAKALGIMAHPAIALSILQTAAQKPIIGTPAHNIADGMADAEPGSVDHSATREEGPDGTADSCSSATRKWPKSAPTHEVINTDTGRITTDPHHCYGHLCGAVTVPVAKLQPTVQIYIHLNPTDGADGAASIEGAGTVATNTLVEMLDGKNVRITPVIDLNTTADEYQYRPSTALKEAIHLTWPTEAFPYSNKSSRTCDLDHTIAYQPASRDPHTTLNNLAPLSRRTHRAKTAGFWTCHQTTPGHLTWTSPLGFRYTIDHHGTRRIE